MGFLKRIVGGAPPPPEWTPYFTGDQYRAFIEAVEADLRRRGLEVEMGDGVVRAHRPGEEGTELGLGNLAQKCNISPPADWQKVIAEHFSAVLQMQGRDLDAIAADFEQASRILRLRIAPDESTGGMGDQDIGTIVLRPLAPGLRLGLVYDFPDSTASVSESHVALWPYSEDEILGLARDNTLAEPLPPRDSIDVEAGARVDFLHGDSFYVASRVLDLASLLSGSPHGAIVGIPNRHVLAWHEIVDWKTAVAVNALIRLVAQQYSQGPGSISNQLYWWQDGDLTHLPVHYEGGSVDFVPPQEFIDRLDSLLPDR